MWYVCSEQRVVGTKKLTRWFGVRLFPFMVELRGVEPLSEDKSVQLSTSVAIVLGFPRRVRPIAGWRLR